MHSGKVPQELNFKDFEFLKDTKFSFIYGKEDEYLKSGVIKVEEERLQKLFPNKLKIFTFDGGHEVNTEIISKFS